MRRFSFLLVAVLAAAAAAQEGPVLKGPGKEEPRMEEKSGPAPQDEAQDRAYIVELRRPSREARGRTHVQVHVMPQPTLLLRPPRAPAAVAVLRPVSPNPMSVPPPAVAAAATLSLVDAAALESQAHPVRAPANDLHFQYKSPYSNPFAYSSTYAPYTHQPLSLQAQHHHSYSPQQYTPQPYTPQPYTPQPPPSHYPHLTSPAPAHATAPHPYRWEEPQNTFNSSLYTEANFRGSQPSPAQTQQQHQHPHQQLQQASQLQPQQLPSPHHLHHAHHLQPGFAFYGNSGAGGRLLQPVSTQAAAAATRPSAYYARPPGASAVVPQGLHFHPQPAAPAAPAAPAPAPQAAPAAVAAPPYPPLPQPQAYQQQQQQASELAPQTQLPPAPAAPAPAPVEPAPATAPPAPPPPPTTAPPAPATTAEPGRSRATLRQVLQEDCPDADRLGFCASPPRYPSHQVSLAIHRCRDLLTHLYVPVPDIPITGTTTTTRPATNGERANREVWSWARNATNVSGGGGACASDATKVLPGYAKDANGRWLVVVQAAGLVVQPANVDVCRAPDQPCPALAKCSPPGGHSARGTHAKVKAASTCEQRFTPHHVVTWDPDAPERCPRLSVVMLPTACTCRLNVDG